jgi:branched-chain amino acid transport system permease protein
VSERTRTLENTGAALAGSTATPRLTRTARVVGLLLLAVVVALVPLYVDQYWLQLGLFAMAAIVAVTGLVILTGAAGQVSLGHAFFLAVGAYGYTYLAGSGERVTGLGLPPVLAAGGAVGLAALLGLAVSPMASRLRGIYLAIATLGLVFLGQHILFNVSDVTGGYNGANVPTFSIGDLSFGNDSGVVLAGVPLGTEEMLWYLFAVVTALALLGATRILRGRPGRAFRFMRDSEVGAAAMGINVPRTKTTAFAVSSAYAGLGGVLTGLAFQRTVPEYFSLGLSIDFLAMLILGGATSVAGAAAGAAFVVALPLLFSRYAENLPLITAPGQGGGIEASVAAQVVFGALIVAVLVVHPDGLAGLWRRLRRKRPSQGVAAA